MDQCHVNHSCCRPYQTTCGMGRPMPHPAVPCRDFPQSPQMPSCASQTSCGAPTACTEKKSVLEHADHLPLAMAYVPCQKFHTTFDLCYALNVGTIFPELCMPFCGKRGMCR